ncbi:MAG: hypothetical protein FWD05_02255 [Oscillospiraceae bacterium]|nr:hypothetical protein [Oscillospiraceae bacterium]
MKRKFYKLWVLVLVMPMLLLAACSDEESPNETEADTDLTVAAEVDPAPAINPITVPEIRAAQTAWGDGLVAISTAFADGEDYVTIAAGVLEDLYGYGYGPVLFKPTIASDVPFRFDWDGAASYFIGTSAPNTIYEDASGFATNPWTAVSFENDWEFIINGETAIGMGTVVITDGDGDLVTVQKSMAWFRGTDGNLRLQLHHSSVPFA